MVVMSKQVSFSMLEIYNEQIRDLLNKRKTPPGGLKLKESSTKGFYGDVKMHTCRKHKVLVQ